MFYAAINSYATETSIGFSNTWSAIGFATRQMRDAFVKRATDRATQAITASEIRKYGGKRGEISYFDADGSFFVVERNGPEIVMHRSGETIDPVTAKPVTDGIYTHG